jgi:anaerobic magnesium-protoporphyrin IX monomethyl ester cyclase
MKVSLISPYSELSSIGIRTLSSYLKANGIPTRMIFLPLQRFHYFRESFSCYSESVVEQLADLVGRDDLVGISLMSNYYQAARDLTVALKRRCPSLPVIWGGIHPTVAPEQCLETADYVCIGEGELPLLDLCRALQNNQATETIPGIWTRRNGVIRRNSPDRAILDFDQTPPQDYDLEDNYLLRNSKKLIPLTRDNISSHMGITYWTLYTRGCLFRCSYCCNDSLGRIHKDFTRLRARSPEFMVREITSIKKRYPFIEYVYFCDDTLIGLPEREIQEFCRQYRDHIGMPFVVSGFHPALINEAKLSYLVDAGMIRVRMGIQSGSDAVLALYNRKQTRDAVVRASQMIARYRRKLALTGYDIILDNPWETQADKLMTLDLLADLAPPYSLNIFSLEFFPGNSLHAKALADHLISEDNAVDHYHYYQPTYLNMIVSLYGLFKLPRWLHRILLSKRLVNTRRRFPLLCRLLYALVIYRRGFAFFLKREYAMFPPALGRFFCRIRPPISRAGASPTNS